MSNNNDLTFVWIIKKNGIDEEIELVENGKSLFINDENKEYFIDRVYILIKQD